MKTKNPKTATPDITWITMPSPNKSYRGRMKTPCPLCGKSGESHIIKNLTTQKWVRVCKPCWEYIYFGEKWWSECNQLGMYG